MLPYFMSLSNFVSANSCSILFALEGLLPFNYKPVYLLIVESFTLFSFLEWYFKTSLDRWASKSHLKILGKPQKLASSAVGTCRVTGIA